MTKVQHSAQDFASNQTVRWCPGCGDYAVLKSLQKVLAQTGIPREQIVVVSGIGCAGRMPYYLSTYGIHGLHGRAVAIATGLKRTRPELSVWVVTGDGDSLSIGANHLLHGLRRNIDINILCLNNRVYGLTKGQYSPTSVPGQVTPTSPAGVQDQPVDPIRFALTAGASFVARGLDVDAPRLESLLLAAQQHRGAAFIEIWQNCPVFNDGAFEAVRDKQSREQHLRWLADSDFDPTQASIIPAMAMAESVSPEQPIPFGLFRQVTMATAEIKLKTPPTLRDILTMGSTWHV